jgi:hypothetical protein
MRSVCPSTELQYAKEGTTDMQSWMALLLAGTLISPILGSSVAYADTPAVSAEIETIVDAAYEQWHSSLGIRQSCSSGVSFVFQQLDGQRGEYRTQTGEVVIDPTDSVAGMDAIVVHELSHHTFLACGAFTDPGFGAAFYASQGLPEDRDWFDYTAGWAGTPAEHFAEAMAITISGSGEGGIAVGSETTAVVSRWLAGAPNTTPADSYEPVPYSKSTDSESSSEIDKGNEQPSVQPAAAPLAEPVMLDILGEIVEFSPKAASFHWLNGWQVIGPI